MNGLIQGFKTSATLAGEICNFPPRKLIRDFGLNDFLENKIHEEDDAPTIAVKALQFFCEEADPSLEIFKFGVLAVGSFLNNFFANKGKRPLEQPLKDLVGILMSGGQEDQIWKWIESNY